MSQTWDCRTLTGVYARMVRAGARFIVVGGQAINLWAEHYRQFPDPEKDWESLAPFTSRALDCLGGSVDALAVGRDFRVRAQVYDPFGKAWTPSVADVHVPVEIEGEIRTLLVQFLHTVKGLNSNEVESSARELEWAGVTLRVLHPFLCLESKLANLWGLDQERPPRQDLKHARLSCLSLHAFLRERLAGGHPQCKGDDERGLQPFSE